MRLQEKYHQTTYWSCVTIQTDVHCGWHEPILAGGSEIAAAPGVNARREEGRRVGVLVALVGLGLGAALR